MQLAVTDALYANQKLSSVLVAKVQKVVRKLKNPKQMKKLRKATVKLPILSNLTR